MNLGEVVVSGLLESIQNKLHKKTWFYLFYFILLFFLRKRKTVIRV